MPGGFYFHLDATLETPVDTGTPIPGDFTSAGSKDVQLFFGSLSEDIAGVQANSDPGTDPIVISPDDSAPGAGFETSAIKLATSQAGLDSAVAGADLEIGTLVEVGVGNAFNFWARLTNSASSEVTSMELSLTTNTLRVLMA